MSSYTLYPDKPSTKGRFNPRCREDVISRNTWTGNVTNTDEARHAAYRRKIFMKEHPEIALRDIQYYLNKEDYQSTKSLFTR